VLRGAFIGFGNVAANGHLPGWQARDDLTMIAATDVLSTRRDAFLQACPGGRWYQSVDDLLSNETLDFVDICAPPSSHAALITRALDTGLHVLCEKPLVTRLDDARSLAPTSARAGRVVHSVHNWLKAPICKKVTALIDAAAIGRTRSIRWQTVRTGPAAALGAEGSANWRIEPELAGGGILLDHGWHALYCVMRWTGAPRRIAAVLNNRRFHEWRLEDTARLALVLNSGTADIYLTWAGDERSNCIEIDGEHGHITVANDRVTLRLNSEERHWTCPPSLAEGSHHPDWFMCVAADFLAAVLSGGRSNLDEAISCAELIDLAQRSSAAGGVSLPTGDSAASAARLLDPAGALLETPEQ
jgi:predicted dehydrogenase